MSAEHCLALPRIVAALCGLYGAAAVAAGPASVLVQADAIKQQALELGLQAARLRDEAMERAGPGTFVYLGTGNSGAAIAAASLAVDGAAPLSLTLTAEETQVLQQGQSRYRMARLALAPGTHHLHAEVQLKYPGDEEPSRLALDQDAGFDAAPGDLVLAPEGKHWLSTPVLALHLQTPGPVEDGGLIDLQRIWNEVNGPEVRDGAYRPGSEADPLLGYARLLIDTRDHFKAVVVLRRLAERLDGASLPPAYYLMLSDALLGCDALEPAQQAYQQAADAGLDAAAAAELRTRIGEAWYERQDYPGAEAAMGAPPSRRAKKAYSHWQDLRSRILLAQGRFDTAAEALKAAEAGADFESYVRYYNLGVALVQNGFGPQGATVLDRVGNVPGNNHDMHALSDRANLALGAYLLENGQGATAIPVLQRIEISGPYSDRALLELGWAWLAPPGDKQARVMLGDERTQGPPPETVGALRRPFDTQNVYQRYHLRPFVRARLDQDRDARVKRALVAWSELLGRDSASDAVQEAHLAAAVALDGLGAHQEAAELYDRGVQALDAADRAAGEAAQYVRGGRWVGELLDADAGATRIDRNLHHLPPPGVAVQLYGTMAGWGFQNGLEQYRVLQALAANLDASLAEAGEGEAAPELRQEAGRLRADLEALQGAEVAALRQQLLDQLELRHRRLAKLIEGARFEVARIYDGAAR